MSRREVSMLRLSFALAALLFAAPSISFADDHPPDTVHLVNGGLVRGTVIEEDPQNGVSIQLIDGTTKKIPAKQVKNVEYALAAAATPPPAPPATAVPPAAPAPPAYGAYPGAPYPGAPYPGAPYPGASYPGAPAYNFGQQPGGYRTHKDHRSTGLMVLGLILMPIGAVGCGVGAGLIGIASNQSGSDQDTLTTAGAGALIAGGVLLSAGTVFLVVGAPKVEKEVEVEGFFSPTGAGLRGRF